MTKSSDDLEKEDKIVVTIDVCSSTAILEDLLKTSSIKHWRNLLIWLKEYLEVESKKFRASLYKFTGDGWIILFDPPYENAKIIGFLSQIATGFERQFKENIYGVLDTPPDITGLTFGIDEGLLVEVTMEGQKEYIGRAINVACRLQGVINDVDIKAGYRAFMSHRLYNSMREDLGDYSPDPTKRRLRNIAAGSDFSCYRLSISENVFRIIRATYGTKSNQIDVTKEYIREVKDNRLDVTVTNIIARGDPDPGVRKTLTIKYIFEGERQTKTVKEYARLQLPVRR